eukprot:472820_1
MSEFLKIAGKLAGKAILNGINHVGGGVPAALFRAGQAAYRLVKGDAKGCIDSIGKCVASVGTLGASESVQAIYDTVDSLNDAAKSIKAVKKDYKQIQQAIKTCKRAVEKKQVEKKQNSNN